MEAAHTTTAHPELVGANGVRATWSAPRPAASLSSRCARRVARGRGNAYRAVWEAMEMVVYSKSRTSISELKILDETRVEHVRVKISDNGCGIASEDLGKILPLL